MAGNLMVAGPDTLAHDEPGLAFPSAPCRHIYLSGQGRHGSRIKGVAGESRPRALRRPSNRT